MNKKMCIVIISILIFALITGGLVFVINKFSKNNNEKPITNEVSNNVREESSKDFNLIYTNNTNSAELTTVQMGLYNYSNNEYYNVLKVNIPDKYLISNLEYISGTKQIYGIKSYEYSRYNYKAMKDTVNKISDIVTDYAITRLDVSDYNSSKIDKATVLNMKLYSADVGFTASQDGVITINNKKIYYSFCEDSILGPTINGKVIINGQEKIEYTNDRMVLSTEGCLELDYCLSNPNITKSNCEEYLKVLIDMITFE